MTTSIMMMMTTRAQTDTRCVDDDNITATVSMQHTDQTDDRLGTGETTNRYPVEYYNPGWRDLNILFSFGCHRFFFTLQQ